MTWKNWYSPCQCDYKNICLLYLSCCFKIPNLPLKTKCYYPWYCSLWWPYLSVFGAVTNTLARHVLCLVSNSVLSWGARAGSAELSEASGPWAQGSKWQSTSTTAFQGACHGTASGHSRNRISATSQAEGRAFNNSLFGSVTLGVVYLSVHCSSCSNHCTLAKSSRLFPGRKGWAVVMLWVRHFPGRFWGGCGQAAPGQQCWKPWAAVLWQTNTYWP